MKQKSFSRFLCIAVLFALIFGATLPAYAAPPIANPNSYTTNEGTLLNVNSPSDGLVSDDIDPDGDSIEVDGWSNPSVGTLVDGVNPDGTFQYQPPNGFAGTVTFFYTATDNTGGPSSAPAAVVITVLATGANDAPEINGAPSQVSTPPGVAYTFTTINVSDIDAGNGALTLTVTVPPTEGTLGIDTGCATGDTDGSDGTLTLNGELGCINDVLNGLTFTPDPALTPGDMVTLSITVNDNGNTGSGDAGTDSASINIFIAGIVVDELDGVLVEEGNTDTDTYQINLSSPPPTDVYIEIFTDGQCSATPLLTFTNANGTNPLTVTVSSVQDFVLEGDHECLITHQVRSDSDPAYIGMPIENVIATVLDDESDIIIDEGDGVNIAEGNTTPDTYSIRLGSNPGQNINVAITPDAQCMVNGSTTTIDLLFTPADWFAPKTVEVVAVDDGFVEGTPHTCVIDHLFTAEDLSGPYHQISRTVNASVTDNDNVAIVLNHIGGGNTTVSEAGITDMYSVRLQSLPSGDVIVTATTQDSPDQCLISIPPAPPSTNTVQLTFTPGNWNMTQNIAVAAIDDTEEELNPHTCTISHVATSTDDANYNNLAGPNMVVSVADNDTGVNDPPVAVDDNYTTAHDTTLVATAGDLTTPGVLDNDSSGDLNDTITVVIWGPVTPGSGVVTNTNPDGSFTFDPDPGFQGVAQFDYVVQDSGGLQDTGTVTITVAPPATAGVTVDPQALTIEEGDSGSFTLQLTTVPTVGSVTITSTSNSAECVITSTNPVVLSDTTPVTVTVQTQEDTIPEANSSCTITNTLSNVTAPEYSSVTAASVSVTITDDDTGNIPPNAVDDVYNASANTELNIVAPGVLANDIDTDGPSALTVTGNTAPSFGSLNILANGSFTFNAGGTTGTATFTYTVSDGADTATATVTINVSDSPVNNPPIAVNDSYTTSDNAVLVATVGGLPAGVLDNDFDPDGDPLSINQLGTVLPSNGTLVLNDDGSFTYTPELGFDGTVTFNYLATDGIDDSQLATVTIEVIGSGGGNTPPVANDQTVTTTQGTPIAFTLDVSDVDGDTLTFTLGTPSNGTLSGTAPNLTYTPTGLFTGTDSFTYTVDDGNGGTDTATVSIIVTPTGGNTAPVITNATTDLSGTLVVLNATFTDNPGDTHTATIDWGDGSGPQPGLVSGLTVQGSHDYGTEGSFTITITVTDQHGASGTHSLILDIGTGVVRYPPPVALCMDQNFIADSMIRANVPDAIRHTVRCRPIVANGNYTNSPEETPMSSANIGNLEVLQMGVLQAVDVFSPEGLVDLSGVTVCLRGSGTLLHLYGAPRTPHAIPTYPVAAFPGFTCGSIPQTGTLVLVNGSGGTSGSGGGGSSSPASTPIPPTPSDPGLRLNSFPECTAVAYGGVNVRSTPSERGALLGVLSPDTPINLITRVGMWYVIDYQGQTGYVRMDLVAFACGG